MEQDRTVMELGQTQIYDAGFNGDLAPTRGGRPPACVGDDDESVALVQGLFAP